MIALRLRNKQFLRYYNNRMKSVSKCQPQMPAALDRPRLLGVLLRQTYTQHSLEHCFPASKIVDQLLQNKKSKLSGKLKEIEMNGEQQIMQGYFDSGVEEIRELTEYYKYYTQTSILHQPSFFNIMHQHREQQKAYHYHKFKALLDLSGSTHQPSTSEMEREEGAPASSFQLLQQLSMSVNNEESLLIEKLKNKLQRDFGPNRYHTLQEIDKHYIFTKKIQVVPSPSKKNERNNQKYVKEVTDRTASLKKRPQKKRNNTCDSQLFTNYRTEAQSKLKRKKNASMASLSSLGKSTPLTRENSLKCTRTLFNPIGNIENQVKSKILGVKQKIRQQKQELLKKAELGRPKKQTEKMGRRQRH